MPSAPFSCSYPRAHSEGWMQGNITHTAESAPGRGNLLQLPGLADKTISFHLLLPLTPPLHSFFFFWLHPGALLPWVPCVTLTSGRQPGPRSWGFFHNLPALGTLINQDLQIRALQIDCQQSPGSPHWFFHTAALAERNGQTRWERRLGKGSYRAGGAPGVCSNGPGEPRSYGRCPCPWQWWEMR